MSNRILSDKVGLGEISNLAQWAAEVSTGKLSMEEEIKALVYCAYNNPAQDILVDTILQDWLHRQYPKIMAAKVADDPAAPPLHTVNTFRVDDMVYLESRTTEAASLLERYGHWWKFNGVSGSGQTCLLRSIGKQERTEPKKKVEVLVIGRAGDWRYDVTNSIPSPCSEDSIPKVGK